MTEPRDHVRESAYKESLKWQFSGKFCVRTKWIIPSNILMAFGTKYARLDQVKYVEDSL